MEIQDFSKRLEGLEAAVKRQIERDLPKKLGNIAVCLFKENFQREGFFGQFWAVDGWPNGVGLTVQNGGVGVATGR